VPSLELVTISVANDEGGLALLQRLSEARPELAIWGANTFFQGGERLDDDAGRDRLRGIRGALTGAFPREMRD